MADTETQNQLNTALRYGGTVAGTGFTLLAVLSLLSPEQVADLKAQVEILNGSLLTAYGALTKMWIILGPLAVGLLARAGVKSSSVKALAAKLLTIASNKVDPAAAVQAKIEIVNAAADKSISGDAGGVVAPDLAKMTATAVNVVSSAEALKAAKL